MTTEALALLVAGIIWPLIFQGIRKVGLQDRAAQWVAVVCALIIGALAHIMTGGQTDPQSMIESGSVVVAISLVVYRQVIKPYVEGNPVFPYSS